MTGEDEEAREPRWASLKRAAEYLDVSVDFVRGLISRGEIAGYRTGSKLLRVDLNEIDDALHRIPTPVNRAARPARRTARGAHHKHTGALPR